MVAFINNSYFQNNLYPSEQSINEEVIGREETSKGEGETKTAVSIEHLLCATHLLNDSSHANIP